MARGIFRAVERPPIWAMALMVVAILAIVVMLVFILDRGRTAASGPGAYSPPAVATSAPATVSALQRPADRPLSVLFLGDSLTIGTGSTGQDKAYESLVVQALSAGGPIKANVIARSAASRGVQVGDALHNLDSATYDLVVVALGTNDAIHSTLPDFTSQYGQLLGAIHSRSPNVKLVCVGPWGDRQASKPFDAVVQKDCSASGGTYVRISQLYNDESNRWVHAPNPSGSTDNFHPSDAGHARIAAEIDRALGLPTAG